MPRLLPPLRAVAVEPDESGDPVTEWEIVEEGEDEEEGVIFPPRPLARFPESWTFVDDDLQYYLVAVGDDVEAAAPE